MADKKTIQVPDSLDLVQHARLGINGICGTCDPDVMYESIFLTFTNVNPPYQVHHSSMVSGVMPKFMEALPMLRAMSGDDSHKEEEAGIIRNQMEQNMGEDGLIYDRAIPERPWNTGVSYGLASWNEDFANLAGNGRSIDSYDYYYQMTGDEFWKKAMVKAADRICALMVEKEDYAYIPLTGCGNDFSWPKESGWTNLNEPQNSQDGREGSAQFYHTQMARGLSRAYKQTGNERYMEITKKSLDFIMQPKFWGACVELDSEYGARHGHFWGHFHGNLAAARGILEYGLAAQDIKYIRFARDMYEWARQNICMELGQCNGIEGCAVADLTALALQLTESGIGDYWDDAEHLIHNALSQQQVTDMNELKRVSDAGPFRPKDAPWGPPFEDRLWKNQMKKPMPTMECHLNVLERSMGAFSWALDMGRYQHTMLMSCCTGNGNQAFYYAWNAALKLQKDSATVNLFFNRFSPMLDIFSYIPYEGKVRLANKGCKRIQVRIPSWVKTGGLTVLVDGTPVSTLDWAGRYLLLDGLRGNEEIVLQFPLERVKLELMVPTFNVRKWKGNPIVNATFRGPVCIGLEDQGEQVGGDDTILYRQYNKPEYKSLDTAPMKEAPYFVPEKIVRWY